MNSKLVISWLLPFWDFDFTRTKEEWTEWKKSYKKRWVCIACEQSTRKSKVKIPSSEKCEKKGKKFSKFPQYSCCLHLKSLWLRCIFVSCTCSDLRLQLLSSPACWAYAHHPRSKRVHSIEMLLPVTTIQEYKICSLAPLRKCIALR